jgi:hypothetical protein
MAGGIWKTQNKVLPGSYINVSSNKQPLSNATERGVVFTLTQGLSWGENGVVEVNNRTNFLALFGVGIEAPALAGLKQILQRARKVLVYNFNQGVKAKGTIEVLPWDFEAKYAGTKGNDITIAVVPDPTDAARFTVTTFMKTEVVDVQTVAKASDLVANDFMKPSVIAGAQADDGASLLEALSTPVMVQLKGGTDGTVGEQTDALIEAIETYDFNVLTAAGQAQTAAIHRLFATTVIRLRDELGRKVQAVIPQVADYAPDHEGVIVVGNGVKLANGTIIEPTIAAGFVAGATSAAETNESLTYTVFPSAVEAVPRFNEEAQIQKANKGIMIFISNRDTAKIQIDLNSLTSFTNAKNREFSKNRVLRVLDDIANDTRETWEDHFVGKVTNDTTGLDLFKANRADYLGRLQSIGAIMNLDPSADIQVEQGATKDSIVANIEVQPTDAMEKLYMQLTMV